MPIHNDRISTQKDIYKHKKSNRDTSELNAGARNSNKSGGSNKGSGKKEVDLPNQDVPRKSPVNPKANNGGSTSKGRK